MHSNFSSRSPYLNPPLSLKRKGIHCTLILRITHPYINLTLELVCLPCMAKIGYIANHASFADALGSGCEVNTGCIHLSSHGAPLANIAGYKGCDRW